MLSKLCSLTNRNILGRKRSKPFHVNFPHFVTKKPLWNHTTLKKEILTWNDVSVPVFLHVNSCYSAVRFPVHMFFNILNKDDAFVTDAHGIGLNIEE